MPEPKRIGWGIVGCGRMAERRIGPVFAAAQSSELVAFQSRDLARAEAFRDRFGAAAAYSGLDDLLADDRIRAVYIGTPNRFHAEQSIRALEAGRHVLVDKPMALSSADAAKMMDAATRAGRVLGVLHQQRFHPANRQMIELCRQGALGRLLSVRMQIAMWYPTAGAWRGDSAMSGGGAAMDLGPHAIDLLRQIMGSPVRIEARSANLQFKTDVEDHCTARLEFNSGAIAHLEFSYCSHHYGGRIELYGDVGTLIIDGSLQQAQHYSTTLRIGDQIEEPVRTPATHDCFRSAIEDFSDAINHGRPPSVTAADGVESIRCIEALYRSAATLEAVRLD